MESIQDISKNKGIAFLSLDASEENLTDSNVMTMQT
jgi:hypothetical protein